MGYVEAIIIYSIDFIKDEEVKFHLKFSYFTLVNSDSAQFIVVWADSKEAIMIEE